MLVRDGMSRKILTVGPDHTLREAAKLMLERNVGSAVVIDPEGQGPGIVTERDLLRSVGAGESPDEERVADHLTSDLVFASPDWSLEDAAAQMARSHTRHLIVIEDGEIQGVVSVRDIVACWTEDGATSEVTSDQAA